jgi:hypothetical protein
VVDLREDFAQTGGGLEGIAAEGFAEGLALKAAAGQVVLAPPPDVGADPGQGRMRVAARQFGADHAAGGRGTGRTARRHSFSLRHRRSPESSQAPLYVGIGSRP